MGIFGNGRGGHPRGCGDGGMAGTVGAVAAAGGRSGGLSAMVEIVFGGFCLLRTCNFPNLNFLNYTRGVSKIGKSQFHTSFSRVYLDNSSLQNTPQTPYSFESSASQLSE